MRYYDAMNFEEKSFFTDTTMPTYDEVDAALSQGIAGILPAEAQGIICAYVSLGKEDEKLNWLGELLGEDVELERLTDQAKIILYQLYTSTVRQLHDDQFQFDLLLPDDSVELNERTRHLAAWCQSFLFGLNVAGFSEEDMQDEAVLEAINDLSKIAGLSCASSEDIEEDDEIAFVELVEFVRIGVMTFFNTLHAKQIIH